MELGLSVQLQKGPPHRRGSREGAFEYIEEESTEHSTCESFSSVSKCLGTLFEKKTNFFFFL